MKGARRRQEQAKAYRADAVAQKGEIIGGLPMVRWRDGAWSFLLSFQPTSRGWIFSAQLYPHGRGSTEDDWQLLGSWAAAVGAPEDSRLGDTIETAPNAVHKWAWTEPAPAAAPV